MIEVAGILLRWLPAGFQPPPYSVIKAAAGRMGITAWDTTQLSTAKRGTSMTEPTGQNAPPEWYTKPPEWLSSLRPNTPPPSGGGYSAGRQDAELLNAVRAMPENVVNALKEAIQGAQAQSGQSAPQQHAQQNTAGAQQAAQQNPPTEQQETKPAGNKTFADRWFDNSL